MKNSMEEEIDIKKKYPSLPPNYVSIAQLQQRWLQQQQKEKQLQEEEQQQKRQQQEALKNLENSNQTKGPVHKNQENPRNGERSFEGQSLNGPPRRTGENRRGIGGGVASGKVKWKPVEVQNKNNRKGYGKKWGAPKLRGGLTGEEGPVVILSENGGVSGVSSGKNGGVECFVGNFEKIGENDDQRVEKNVSVRTVKGGKKGKIGGLSRKSGWKGVRNGESSRKCDDRGGEGSVGLLTVEVLQQNELEEEVSAGSKWQSDWVCRGELGRNGNDQGVVKERNVMVEVLEKNEEKEAPGGGRRKNGVVRNRDGFWRNGGNKKIGAESKDGKEQMVENELDDEVSVGLRGKTDRKSAAQLERNGDHQGIVEKGKACTVELEENEVEEEVPQCVRRMNGLGRSRGGFQRNGGNRRLGKESKDNKELVEVLPEYELEKVSADLRGKNGQGYRDELGRNGGHQANVNTVDVSEGNEFPQGLRRKNAVGRFRGGFRRNGNNRRIEKESTDNNYLVKVVPENELEDVSADLRGKSGRGYRDELGRNGDHQGTVEKGNVSTVEILEENQVEEEVPQGLRRKNVRRKGNNRRIEEHSKDKKLEVEVEKNGVEEGIFMDEVGRTDQKGKIGSPIRGNRGKERVLGNSEEKIRRDFEVLSLDDSREGHAASSMGLQRGRRGSYGNFGRFGMFPPRKAERQQDTNLVWVKKGEISNTDAAEL